MKLHLGLSREPSPYRLAPGESATAEGKGTQSQWSSLPAALRQHHWLLQWRSMAIPGGPDAVAGRPCGAVDKVEPCAPP